jgi:hypothetical protein
MSDIFISYARPDQTLAQSLAEDLKGRGFKVWWDTELLGSDDFYEVIYTALSNEARPRQGRSRRGRR